MSLRVIFSTPRCAPFSLKSLRSFWISVQSNEALCVSCAIEVREPSIALAMTLRMLAQRLDVGVRLFGRAAGAAAWGGFGRFRRPREVGQA